MRIKERIYTDEAFTFFQTNNIDTSSVSNILNEGEVNFSKSKTDLDPCNIYFVSGEYQQISLELQIENCDSIATIQRIEFLE